MGVLARVPLDEGGLTGTITPETTFPEGDWRNEYFAGDRKRQVHERARALQAAMGSEARSLPELALRFILTNPAVSTIIPGMRKLHNVRANSATSDGTRLPAALMQELRAHRWDRQPTDWSQ